MRNKILVISLLLLFGIQELSAQTMYRFSKREDKFIAELEEFMKIKADRERKAVVDTFVEWYGAMWNDPLLMNKDKKTKIISMCNKMTAKRLRVKPHFENFLLASHACIVSAGLSEELFDKWMDNNQSLLKERSSTRFLKFLTSSLELFNGNYIHNGNNLKWKVSNLNLTIEKEGRFPIFVFSEVDLTCRTRADSSLIEGTKGVYHPISNRWIGETGKVYWTRVGFDKRNVWAELTQYSILLKGTKFFADTVTFYNKEQFNIPLKGSFREQVASGKSGNPVYPQFSSFRTDILIPNMYTNVDYKGGYTLNGKKVIGSGRGDQKAYFIFKRNGEPMVYTGADSYTILKDRIMAQRVTVKITIGDDSIYHPGLSVLYNEERKELSIYREDKGLAMAPFYNSYHQLDMYVEALYWKMTEDYIDLKMIQQPGSQSSAYFESSNYFKDQRYNKLQGLDKINPVTELYNYTEEIASDIVYVDDYSRYIGFSKDVAIKTLMDLSVKGFVIYDINDQKAIVKDRVKQFVDAHNGRVDYDVISFQSNTMGIANASLNIENKDLEMHGVKNVFVSDSQKVYIYPKGQMVIVKKNRDFIFDGLIRAGRFDVYAKECAFSYEKFELDLPIIDSLSFKVPSFDETADGYRPLKRVKAVIEDLRGNILIDQPNNKSGVGESPEYPILNSKKNSYVYYDRKSQFKNVYKRDRFYYRLESFTIDSLDNFETDGLEFQGFLASAGIFPDIAQPLKVQQDYSLGFKSYTGSGGLSAYGGKGRFTDTISLNNEGLTGDGSLEYLTSTSTSNKFFYFPDSVNGNLNTYEIAKVDRGTEFPDVNATDVYTHWMPYLDRMNTKTKNEDYPFHMYESEADLLGSLNLQPDGLTGGGVIAIQDAEMSSEKYRFKSVVYDADTTDFRLKRFVDEDMGMEALSEEDDNAYSTTNFSAHIDFKERLGAFEANGGEQKVEFNDNMYICYMDMFIWYMDEDKTEFASKDGEVAGINTMDLDEQVDLDLTGSEFYSVHPDQDSLNFVAQRAVYRRKSAEIKAFDVRFILTADAAIQPNDGEVVIHRKADMQEFNDANILTNLATKYHKIHNATVKIAGKFDYHGRGIYDYKDANGNIQNIFLTTIESDTTGMTVGEGKIEESANFTFSPYFTFKGKANLKAPDRFLKFSGGTQIAHDCDTLPMEWIYFSDFIDPKEIKIPIGDSLKNMDNLNLPRGIMMTERGYDVYPAFLSRAYRSVDKELMSSDGYLVYDETSQEYRISSEDKLAQLSLSDDYTSLSKRSCQIYSEGNINLAWATGAMKFDSYGKGTYYMQNDSMMLNTAIMMDFFFSEKAMELMVNDINDRMDLTALDLDQQVYRTALGNIVGGDEMENLMTEIATQGGMYRKVPKELITSIFFVDVTFKYNPRSRSFVSEGPIGIANMGKTQINKYVDGVIEVENKKSGTTIRMALEMGGDYYFLEYGFIPNSRSGLMRIMSGHNKEFNTIIKETDQGDKKLKTQGKEPKFTWGQQTPTAYKKFKRTLKFAETER